MLTIIFSIQVNVSVSLPIDIVNNNGTLKDMYQLNAQLKRLSYANVHGIQVDVHWSLVERVSQEYDFSAYQEIVEMARFFNLKVTANLCFHSIPQWALDVARQNSFLFKDQNGFQSEEYLSFTSDLLNEFPNQRSPISIYSQFMSAFRSKFISFINDGIIQTVLIGLGPNGELRFPSTPNQKWKYPGIGMFQASDWRMLEQFRKDAFDAGFDYKFPPTNAGTYNSTPNDSQFFSQSYKSTYGDFFMKFYQNQLISHAKRVISEAQTIFNVKPYVKLAAKIPFTHQWYNDDSHAAEFTSGYYNYPGKGEDSYQKIIEEVFQDVQICVSGWEMQNSDTIKDNCNSNPEELTNQQIEAVRIYAGIIIGSNEHDVNITSQYDQILNNLRNSRGNSQEFVFNRLSQELISNSDLFSMFQDFVNKAAKI
ncbi:Beta-amylase [Hexamita inflata]|uniref:Beta-amylase n=1 Tax=Hexamita inflata TaxID=28002 RepID=A0AA86NH80_9EUKA|nr:Beta-amylase [Hexamita inflata]